MNQTRHQAPSALIAILLYTAELALLLVLLALHKKGPQPLLTFLGAPAGIALLFAALLLVAVVLLLGVRLRRADFARRFWPTALLNVWSVVLILVLLEIGLRVISIKTSTGVRVTSVTLLPNDWKAVARHNQAILAGAAAAKTYLVFDRELGWTVGPSRRSGDYNRAFQERYLAQLDDPIEQRRMLEYEPEPDIYRSSLEGLRSAQVGFSYTDQPARRRIALIGDSFTFGLEVGFEQTWGFYLERLLGPDFQVLNFGVDGYGVSQAFLKYRRDVSPWHPEVVILSVIADDLRRTLCVYGFLCFPHSELPFPMPRHVLVGDTLALLNVPLPAPAAIFATESITTLPFVELDPGFAPFQWEKRFYHHAFTARFLLSRFPRWPVPATGVSEHALQAVNAEIIRTFVRTAKDNRSIPVVVLFPARSAFVGSGSGHPHARQVLLSSGVPFIDMTECVADVPPSERFVVLHYSGTTNATVARCLLDPLTRIVGDLPTSQ